MNKIMNTIIQTISILIRIFSCVPALIVFLYGLMGAVGMSFAGSFSDFPIQIFALLLCLSGATSIIFATIKLQPKKFRFLILYQMIFFMIFSLFFLVPMIYEQEYKTDLIHQMGALALLANLSLVAKYQKWQF